MTCLEGNVCDVCMMYLTAKSAEFPLSVSTDIPQTHHAIVYSTFFSGQLSGFPTGAAGQEREPRGSAATSCRRSERAGSGSGTAPPPGAPRHDRNSPENQQNICFLPSSHWNGLSFARRCPSARPGSGWRLGPSAAANDPSEEKEQRFNWSSLRLLTAPGHPLLPSLPGSVQIRDHPSHPSAPSLNLL